MDKDYEDVADTVTVEADADALTLVDSNLTTDLNGVRVFDVGQGDCVGLLDQADDVFCYVDYGGLNDHPDAKNPSATPSRLPVKSNGRLVPIILTHWDKDHYYSAVKKNTAAQSCDWLVPRQLASPQAVRFAARLANAKCWPESRGSAIARFGVGSSKDIEIRKCKPFDPNAVTEDRNQSGLAITLLCWNATAVDALMVLPGDCHFDGIPHMPSAPIQALIAYHHGSHVDWTQQTTAAIANSASTARLAYSFGANTYGHPDRVNYQPTWDAKSIATEDIRSKGAQFEDFRW